MHNAKPQKNATVGTLHNNGVQFLVSSPCVVENPLIGHHQPQLVAGDALDGLGVILVVDGELEGHRLRLTAGIEPFNILNDMPELRIAVTAVILLVYRSCIDKTPPEDEFTV